MRMRLPAPFRLPALLAAATLALGQPALARNDTLTHPVAPLLNGDGRGVMGDLHVAFGSATAQDGMLVTEGVYVHGVGHSTDVGYRKPTDAEVCDRALFDALNKLTIAARKAGANGIVGIVSDYQSRRLDDPANVECHAGTMKSHVLLRANLVKVGTGPAATP